MENKGGRPKKEINLEQLQKLCAIHCTGEECAAVMDMDYDTLNARVKESGYEGFSDYYKKNTGQGKASLRRLQWQAAQGGNITMLIWLGKQYLGQADKHDNNLSGNVGISIIDDVKKCKKE